MLKRLWYGYTTRLISFQNLIIKATGNSRFETENPPAKPKIPENSRY